MSSWKLAIYVQTLAMMPTVSFPTTVIMVLFMVYVVLQRKNTHIVDIKQKEQLVSYSFVFLTICPQMIQSISCGRDDGELPKHDVR